MDSISIEHKPLAGGAVQTDQVLKPFPLTVVEEAESALKLQVEGLENNCKLQETKMGSVGQG